MATGEPRDQRAAKEQDPGDEHAPPEGTDEMSSEEEVGRGVDGTGAAGTGGTGAKDSGTGSSTGTGERPREGANDRDRRKGGG